MIEFKKRGFTLIELIVLLVIMAIITLIVTPLVMNIIRHTKENARKRSVDAYGRSIELAIVRYLLDSGKFPTNEQLPNLQIEYSGSNVVCNVMAMKENGSVYLSECKVNGVDVLDSSTKDGWYHYNIKDYTDKEYVDMYGDALKEASVEYYKTYGSLVQDYRTLSIKYSGKTVSCDVVINVNATVFLTNCSVEKNKVIDDTDDGYYHYGEIINAAKYLLSKSNSSKINNYTAGNKNEMYTFNHEKTYLTDELTDYRYIGSEPYNYVEFNNGEIWRIVGVFPVENENRKIENRLKLINDNSIFTSEWNWINSTDSWENSLIKSKLERYYGSMDDISKKMIGYTKFFLGGIYSFDDGEKTYYSERSNSANRFYNQPATWLGNIALIYPSDYIFTYALGVDNTCYNSPNSCNRGVSSSGWISTVYGWTANGYLKYSNTKVNINSSVNYSSSNTGGQSSVFPVVYLKPNIRIKSGDGSSINPYKLEI